MKLREIARYEIEYRIGTVSTWVYALLLCLVTFWISMITADGAAGLYANAPGQIVWGFIRGGLFSLLVSAALFGDAATRDVAVEMDPLIFTSPLKKIEYLGGRFLGALAVNAVVVLAVPAGLLIMTAVLARTAPELLGPLRPLAYIQPFFVFSLPNAVFAGALLFAIGTLARHVVPVYLGAIGLFIGYIVVLNYSSQIDSPALRALLDPLGMVTLEGITAFWTTAERNTQLIGLPAALAWNRAMWLAIAAMTLALLHWRFRFAHAAEARIARRFSRRRRTDESEGSRTLAIVVPRAAGAFGVRTAVRQTLAVARNTLADTTASRWFPVVLLACVGMPMLWGWNVGDTVFDTSTWPVTFLITEVALAQRARLLFIALVILFAGELVWKEREVGTAEIADAAPVSDGAGLCGRFLALVVIIVAFQAAATTAGVLIQVLQGYTNFEPWLYARVMFGLQLADYVLLGALAMTVHVLVNHKNLGHMVALMAFIFTRAADPLLDIGHNLLLYGRDPGWTYSDMNGFGPFATPLVWFRLYWGAWALLLLVLAAAFRVRGREPGVGARLRQAAARMRRPAMLRTAAAAAVLVLACGGFIFYNTNVLNAYRSAHEAGSPQAAYEARYGQHRDLPQPTIASANLRVEIYPEQPAVYVRGSYQLLNRTGGVVDSLHVYVDPDVTTRAISVEGGAAPSVVDEEAGYRIFPLAQPMQPGESRRLTFDVGIRRNGFPNSNIPTAVVENGTVFNRRYLPFVGYQPLFELIDEEVRERHGLPPRTPLPSPSGTGGRRYRQPFTDADLVQVDMVIGTSADQIAVAPGVLRREWTEGGRRHFEYSTERPEPFGAVVASARYSVVEDRWTPRAGGGRPVTIRVLHHPGHAYNLSSFTSGVKAALDYLTPEFGSYPYGELRIVEVPRYDSYGRAHPYMIEFTENFFLTRPKDGEFDQVFFGVAHELAHTWWGGQVRSASDVSGGQGFVSEALANYSAMMVTEKTFGMDAAREVYDYQMWRYLRMRAERARDVPLLEAQDHAYITYGKGAVALYTLRQQIGEERLHSALRGFLEQHRDGQPPYPTSYDLYSALRAAAPESLHPLLTDLFETVTLWDMRIRQASVDRTAAGDYEVTLNVSARKVRSDEIGNETEVPMDDLVEVGLFEADGETPFYLARHRIRDGEQTIQIVVPREPARAGLDPGRQLIERNRDDNVVTVAPPPRS